MVKEKDRVFGYESVNGIVKGEKRNKY